MIFKEFLYAYRENTLDQRAAWRAYNILGAVKIPHVMRALKALGYKYAGELSIPTFMAQYKIGTREEAQSLLGAWWLLSQIEAGGKPKGVSLNRT